MYTSDTEDTKGDEYMEKDVANSDDTRKMRQILIKIMSSQTSSLGVDYSRSSIRSNNRLLEEIELFSKTLMEVDDG